MWRKGIRVTLVFSLATLILSACLSVPQVSRSRLAPSEEPVNSGRTPQAEELFRLYESMRGAQSGDVIFNRSTAVYWIVPEIDKMDLKITAREEGFTEAEYDARLSRLVDTHGQFLIFLIDLRMPFYPGWTQSQLLNFLEQNFLVTLENGTGIVYTPGRQIFQVLERYIEANPVRPSGQSLEVRVPIRVFFSRESNPQPLISEQTNKLVLKLRLRERPPFRIGFFDEKYYQSFAWKIGE